MLSSLQHDRKVVLGLGNLLCGDEGFGIHAMRFLHRQVNTLFAVEWIDGGVLGLNLLPLVESCSHLLVLDAVDGGWPPGSMIDIIQDELPLYSRMKLSEHQVGFQEVLALARFRCKYPTYLHLLGVQPQEMIAGIELSTVVQGALPAVAQRAKAILKHWFTYERRSIITVEG